MALRKETKAQIIAKYGKDGKDSGSVEVQVALLTEQIKKLTEHMKANTHDYSSKRGLDILVGKRRGLLEYLKANDFQRYNKLVKDLGLRR